MRAGGRVSVKGGFGQRLFPAGRVRVTHLEAVSTPFPDWVAGEERGLGLEPVRTEEEATCAERHEGPRSRGNGARDGERDR